MGARSGGGGGGSSVNSRLKGYAAMSRNDIANRLQAGNGMSRWPNPQSFEMHYDEKYRILYDAATKTNTFGGKIAKDIIDRTEAASKKYKKTLMPNVSSKQAWAIANALSSK